MARRKRDPDVGTALERVFRSEPYGRWYFAGLPALAFLGLAGAVAAVKGLGAPVCVIPFLFPGLVGSYWIFLVAVVAPRVDDISRRARRRRPSPEGRAAARPPSRPRPPVGDPVWPTVPAAHAFPGNVLPHSLSPPAAVEGCMVVAAALVLAVVSAIWFVGPVAFVVWVAVQNVPQGGGCAIVGVVPYVLVTAYLFTRLLWPPAAKLVTGILAGRLTVEVSAHPFQPGGRYDLHLAHAGPFRVRDVSAAVVREEAAAGREGTTRTDESRVVAVYPAGVAGWDGRAVLVPEALAVPADAMHSFRAGGNEIRWRVRLAGRVLGVGFTREYPVVVVPGG